MSREGVKSETKWEHDQNKSYETLKELIKDFNSWQLERIKVEGFNFLAFSLGRILSLEVFKPQKSKDSKLKSKSVICGPKALCIFCSNETTH